jgi:hypothetical protein
MSEIKMKIMTYFPKTAKWDIKMTLWLFPKMLPYFNIIVMGTIGLNIVEFFSFLK